MALAPNSFRTFVLAAPSFQILSFCAAIALGASLAPIAHAQPEQTFACDGTAYLTTGHLSRTYALDLNSGDYKVAADYHESRVLPPYAWTKKSSLDALGFNPNDGFAYGWSQFHHTVVRMYSDFSVDPLNVATNEQKHFYVGDVSGPDNMLYLYNRNGKNTGLYAVNLDSSSKRYLSMNLIADSTSLSLDVEDFAVHPFNGKIYAIEANGTVVEVDPASGTRTDLGNSEVYGNLGSAFFDDDGNLYVVRNYDGATFRIGIDSGAYKGEKIAHAPSATAADGFRCAKASFSPAAVQLSDFGDAPDSYGTYADTNGARHSIFGDDPLRMGEAIDGESDAYAHPLSDNSTGDDEDGVAFVSSLVSGQRARTIVSASGDGFVNVWLDTNRDGVFDAAEQLVTDQAVSEGDNQVILALPSDLSEGKAWARYRLSSTPGLQATGPAADGEVEDHQIKLLEDRVSVSSYPSTDGWSTVAFEDNWPFVGDYDMNDMVVQMRTRTYKNASGVTQVDMEGYVASVGAFYENGFAVRLPGVPRDAIDETKLEFVVSDIDVVASPLEPGREEAIFIITDNVFKHVTPGASCDYYRSEYQCGADLEFKFSLSIPFKQAQNADLSGLFDPFLFATPGAFHGAHFLTPPGRGYEIHLKNQSPTEAFDERLFAGVGQDASDPAAGKYFLTSTGMPWALEIGTAWNHPYEYVELSAAYPDFPPFAESNGRVNQNWYMKEKAVTDLIFPE